MNSTNLSFALFCCFSSVIHMIKQSRSPESRDDVWRIQAAANVEKASQANARRHDCTYLRATRLRATDYSPSQLVAAWSRRHAYVASVTEEA